MNLIAFTFDWFLLACYYLIIMLQPALKEPLVALKAAAQRIGEVSKAKGLDIDVEEYVTCISCSRSPPPSLLSLSFDE